MSQILTPMTFSLHVLIMMHCRCIKLIYLMLKAFKNKLGELDCHLNTFNTDIICITETWLHPSLPDSVVISDINYFFCKDRCNDREGGGVCILINNSTVKAVPYMYLLTSIHWMLFLSVSSESNFRLFVVY